MQNQRNELMQLLLSASVFLVVLGLMLWMVAGATITAYLKVITTNLPWIIGGVLGIVLAVPAGKLAVKGAIFLHHYRQALRDARFIRIVPANDTHFDREQVLTFARAFGGMVREWRLKWRKGEPWFRLRFYEDDKGQILIYVGYPQDKENGVYDSIKAIYPQARILPVSHADFPRPKPGGSGGHFILRGGRKKGLPLASIMDKKESQLGDILSRLRPETMLDIQFTIAGWEELEERSEEVLENLQAKKEKDLNPHEKEQKKILTKSLTGNELTFQVVVSIWSNHEHARAVVRSVANAVETTMNFSGAIRFFRHDWWNPIKGIHPIPLPLPFLRMTWTDKELSNLFHLPPGDHQIYKEPEEHEKRGHLVHLIPGQNDIPEGCRQGVKIGYDYNPLDGIVREVCLSEGGLRTMMLIVGQTGSGKSAIILAFLRYLLKQWFEGKPFGGFTLIDPKATTVYRVLTDFLRVQALQIPFDEEKVHYFDVSSNKYAIGLNLLERFPGQTDNDVVNNALEVMRNAYNIDSMLFDKYARLAIKALLADKEQTHTILAIPEILKKESPLRQRLIRQLSQGTTQEKRIAMQLIEEEDNFGSKSVEPVLNRLTPLLENPTTQRIFGQKKTSLEVLRYMEEGHVVLFNVEGLTKEEMRLVMGYIITLYHQFAQKRKNQQQNHYLCIDESHEVQLPVLHEQIIPKDRERGLILVLLTQFLEQFKKELKDAITEISGNIIACRSGYKTARVAAEELMVGRFRTQDLQELPDLVAAVYTSDVKGKRTSFFIRTDPPYIYRIDGQPTYYGEDRNRRDAEKNTAFSAGIQFGMKCMARDCLSAEEAQRQIDEYLESLWEPGKVKNDTEQGPADEVAATTEKTTNNDDPPTL